MMPPSWTADYMGIPFVDHGRDRTGCDCYGLSRLILLEQFAIPAAALPLLLVGYVDTQDRAEIARMINVHLPLLDFGPVFHPRPGDVVLIRNGGSACHLGVMVTRNLVLHTEASAGPRFDDIHRPHISPRVEGIYRYGV